MKWFKRILLGLLILVILLVAGIYIYLKTSGPDYSGNRKITGLKENVEVKFDQFGVPHIYAKSRHDAYLSLGWIQAQDRLFQMEMIRRVSTGQLSEILGVSLIDIDKSMITLGIKDMTMASAEKYFTNGHGDFQEASLAYLQGVNDFIENGRLPIEFKMIGFTPEPFTPEDIYTIIGFMSYGFSSGLREDPYITEVARNLNDEYLKIFKLDSASVANMNVADSIALPYLHQIWMAQNQVNLQLPVAKWTGSNGWLLSGNKTKSGKPILANDTHIKYAQPSVWYETYLEYPGHQFYGYYLAGVPFAIEGHNSKFGWGLTIFPFDNMNLYSEKINPENKNQYWNGNHWVDFEIINYKIKVKNSHDINFEMRKSKHGPIMNDAYPKIKSRFNDDAIALWWSSTKVKSTTLEATYLMNNAANMEDFEKALSRVDIVGLNVMYADEKGNIAWWATGKLPIVGDHINTHFILDGTDSSNTITGFYPFEKNPKSINPDCGYIVTANNPPHAVDGRIYRGYYAPGLRAKRIENLLNQKEKWSAEDLQNIQKDVHSKRDLKITKLALDNIEITDETNPQIKRLAEYLKQWDGNYDVNSVGATIFTRFLFFLMEEAMMDEMGEENFQELASSYLMKSSIERFVYDENSVWWDNMTTDKKETRGDIINIALAKTATSFLDKDKKLRSDLRWGKAHQLLHIHPIGRKEPFDKVFNVGPFEKSGSNEVIDKEGFSYNGKGSYAVISGPALRTIVDFADANNAQAILPTGQSGNVFSPYYSDQAKMFVEGKYRRQILTFTEGDKYRTLILKPKK